jgi:hypothetical protein
MRSSDTMDCSSIARNFRLQGCEATPEGARCDRTKGTNAALRLLAPSPLLTGESGSKEEHAHGQCGAQEQDRTEGSIPA